MDLLSTNTKINKTNKAKIKYYAKIMQLAPHKSSGYNACPSASASCSAECLYYAGFGRFKNVQNGRINKTKLFFEDRKTFIKQLHQELSKVYSYCSKKKLLPAIRLNALSDISWEQIEPSLFTNNTNIQFYDYTKIKKRYLKFLNNELPDNYHLTFSRSENNESDCLDFLDKYEKAQVAVVFNKIPKQWKGYSVCNADLHDLRFLDKAKIAGLMAKGLAKKDTSGFVVVIP